jgi:type IV pilus assembly protein PilA
MIDVLKKRRQEGEEGFTLIELMVVVLIIAILLAIAIPTFLGARKRAQDRAAQSSLRNSLTAAKTIFTDSQSYTSATTGELNATEPSINHVADTTGSTGAKTVSVSTPDANTFVGAARSDSGKCFYIRDISGGAGTQGTSYGTGSGAACKTSDTISWTGW